MHCRSLHAKRRAAGTLAATFALALVAAPVPGASAWTTPTSEPARIVYVNEEGGDKEVYTMNADGSGRSAPLTNNAVGDCDPVFSPGGDKIAWVSANGADESELWVMDATGANKTPLTFNVGEYVRTPTWSPDGNTILFQRSAGYSPGASTHDNDIGYVTFADGAWSAERRFLATPAWEWQPAISPDGTKVAFERDVDRTGSATSDVYVADVRTILPGVIEPGEVRQVTRDPASDSAPSWSPDGTRLVFERGYIYTVSLATGAERKISKRGGMNPDWGTRSPDEVVFEANTNGNWNLNRLNVATGATTAITTSKAADIWGDW
jgi:TolB protein